MRETEAQQKHATQADPVVAPRFVRPMAVAVICRGPVSTSSGGLAEGREGCGRGAGDPRWWALMLWRMGLLIPSLWGLSVDAGMSVSAWEPVSHRVRSGETLRLIARRYFGVKQGWLCLQQQLKLTDPNAIEVGQELRFLAPGSRVRLAEYVASAVDCGRLDMRRTLRLTPVREVPMATWSPALVAQLRAHTDTPSASLPPGALATNTPQKIAPEDAQLDVEEHDPESQRSRGWQRTVQAHLGGAFMHLDQRLQATSEGAVRYQSVEAGAWRIESIWAISHRWALRAERESIPGRLAEGNGYIPDRFAITWRSTRAMLEFWPRGLRHRLGGGAGFAGLIFGLKETQIPLASPLTGVFTNTVYASEGSLRSLLLGVSGAWLVGERWRSEFRLCASNPFDFAGFENINLPLQVYIDYRWQYRFASRWVGGIAWSGSALSGEVENFPLGVRQVWTTDHLFSSLWLSLGVNFD